MTTSPSPSSGGQLPASLDGDELVERKKNLVAAFDSLVTPLGQILELMKKTETSQSLVVKLMRRHQTSVAVVVIVLLVVVGVALHTTMRLAAIEAQLDIVSRSQTSLEQTASSAASAAVNVEQQTAGLSQVTIEPAETPSGSPTAVVVVHPAPKSSGSKQSYVLPIANATAPTGSGKPSKAPKDADGIILRIEP